MSTDVPEPFWRGLRKEALALPAVPPPAPWTHWFNIHVGGVVAGGWTRQEEVVLISSEGFSLTEPRSGQRLERERDAELTYAALSQDGLHFTHPTTDEDVLVFGLHGGGGSQFTEDNWGLETIAPQWPGEEVILWEPSHSAPGQPFGGLYFAGAHRLQLHLSGELLGHGFAPSGKHFIVVATDGAFVASRD